MGPGARPQLTPLSVGLVRCIYIFKEEIKVKINIHTPNICYLWFDPTVDRTHDLSYIRGEHATIKTDILKWWCE